MTTRYYFGEEAGRALIGQRVRSLVELSGVPTATTGKVIRADPAANGYKVAVEWDLRTGRKQWWTGSRAMNITRYWKSYLMSALNNATDAKLFERIVTPDVCGDAHLREVLHELLTRGISRSVSVASGGGNGF